MTEDQLSLLGAVIPLFPIAYFFLSSLSFFVAKFEDPVVIRVLRGLLHAYTLGLIGGSSVAALAYAAIGRWPVAAGMALAAAGGLLARLWFLRRLDGEVAARNGGDTSATRRLRRLHLTAIGYNAAHLVLLLASIPRIVTAH